MKKLLSFPLALTLSLSLATFVLADDNDSGSAQFAPHGDRGGKRRHDDRYAGQHGWKQGYFGEKTTPADGGLRLRAQSLPIRTPFGSNPPSQAERSASLSQ